MNLLTGTGHQISDTLVMTRRNLIRYTRLPRLIFFSSIQPIMFLTLFNFVFGGAIGATGKVPGGGPYINYLLPGILAQVVLFGAVQTGIGLADDMGKGIIDRFRSLPMGRGAVMSGRTLADTVRNFMVIIILVVVGTLYGFRFSNGIYSFLGMTACMLLFGFAFCWVMAFIGMSVGDPETAQLASFLIIFPLTFASAAFLPTATMPGWLQVFANHQPVTYAAVSARHFAIGTPANGAVWHLLLWCIGLLAIFVPLSIWRYRSRT